MAKEEKKECCKDSNWSMCGKGTSGGGDAVYGFGLIGALVYYIGTASSFTQGLVGVLKSLVWPAMLVYHLLKYLKL